MVSGFARYVPAPGGSGWLGIIRGRFLAVVPSGTSAMIVQELWCRAAHHDASLEHIVGSIPLVGEHAVESFAIAEFPQRTPNAAGQASAPQPDCTISAVVRGEGCLDVYSVGGVRRFGAGGVSPWLLSDFRSVTSVVAGTREHPMTAFSDATGGSLPVEAAAVVTHQLTWTLSPWQPSEPELDEETVVRLRVAGGAQSGPDDTIMMQRRAQPRSAAPPAIPTPPIATPVSAAARISAPTPALAPAAPRHEDKDPQPAPAPFRFRIGEQPCESLQTPALIGREPVASGPEQEAAARLFPVRSPRSEVSATHLRLAQEGSAIVVTDLRSTNGTVVIPPGRRPVRLRSGTSLVVVVGTRIDIGDGNIIEILPDTDSADRTIE